MLASHGPAGGAARAAQVQARVRLPLLTGGAEPAVLARLLDQAGAAMRALSALTESGRGRCAVLTANNSTALDYPIEGQFQAPNQAATIDCVRGSLRRDRYLPGQHYWQVGDTWRCATPFAAYRWPLGGQFEYTTNAGPTTYESLEVVEGRNAHRISYVQAYDSAGSVRLRRLWIDTANSRILRYYDELRAADGSVQAVREGTYSNFNGPVTIATPADVGCPN